MPPSKDCRWFLQPLNEQTNEIIARMLNQQSGSAEIQQLPTDNGSTVNVWECSYSLVDALLRSRRGKNGPKFKILNCSGAQRTLRYCPWLMKHKPKIRVHPKPAEIGKKVI